MYYLLVFNDKDNYANVRQCYLYTYIVLLCYLATCIYVKHEDLQSNHCVVFVYPLITSSKCLYSTWFL